MCYATRTDPRSVIKQQILFNVKDCSLLVYINVNGDVVCFISKTETIIKNAITQQHTDIRRCGAW